METVRSLDKDLWVIDQPFKLPGGIELGTRTTLVRLSDASLWVHSPGPLTPAIRAWLEENGPVGAIVAPNLLHHLFLREAVDACPDAAVFGPPGLDAKVDVAARVLDGQETPWAGDLELVFVGGSPKMNELVFFHAGSRTLIVTDLAFNFRSADSFITRIFLRINGSLGSFGPSRLGKRVFLGDRAEIRLAIDRILEWDFDRIVLSHGEVLETGGRDALRDAFTWVG
jgi:hypothetical protein